MTTAIAEEIAAQTTNNTAAQILTDAERQPCEVWTRVMGYFRPVSSFNRGKQGEYHERKCFHESSSL